MELINRSEEDIKNASQEFTKRYLRLLQEKKGIDQDIKELKQEYALDGIDVKNLIKAVNEVKKKIKTKETDVADFEKALAHISEEDIIRDINELVS